MSWRLRPRSAALAREPTRFFASGASHPNGEGLAEPWLQVVWGTERKSLVMESRRGIVQEVRRSLYDDENANAYP